MRAAEILQTVQKLHGVMAMSNFDVPHRGFLSSSLCASVEMASFVTAEGDRVFTWSAWKEITTTRQTTEIARFVHEQTLSGATSRHYWQ
jgi:hypothetical protein